MLTEMFVNRLCDFPSAWHLRLRSALPDFLLTFVAAISSMR
jgi:hypothetical protein